METVTDESTVEQEATASITNMEAFQQATPEERRGMLEGSKIAADIQKTLMEIEVMKLKVAHDVRDLQDEEAEGMRHRVYTFFGGMTQESIAEAIQTLAMWARRYPGQPFHIVFNSPGGSVYDGLALFDFLKSLQVAGHEITTEAVGMAASMGGILLQAGNWRVLGRHSWMLIHEIQGINVGNTSTQDDNVGRMKRLQEQMIDIYAERSTMTRRQIKSRWSRKDWWLDAEEALKLGFIDEIR